MAKVFNFAKWQTSCIRTRILPSILIFIVLLIARRELYFALGMMKKEGNCYSSDRINIEETFKLNQNKLSLIVGNKGFTNALKNYCSNHNLKVITKNPKIASKFWVMDSDEYEKHPNREYNVIHSPFYTLKEHTGEHLSVKQYDFIYYFINKNSFEMISTLKLIDYAVKIHLKCFVLITNIVNNNDDIIINIESYLKHSNLNYVIFNLKNIYITNDTEFSNNHPISLMIHEILQHNQYGKHSNSINNHLHQMFASSNDYFDILYLNDMLPYIAVAPFNRHLYGHTFNVTTKQNIYSLNYLRNEILSLLKINMAKNDIYNPSINVQNDKFECYFFGINHSNKFKETSISNILAIMLIDIQKNKDLISRKKNFQRFDKSAVFCDTRYDENTVKVVLNYMINLDQSWLFQLYVSENTIELWENHEVLKPYIQTNKIIFDDISKYYDAKPVEYYQSIEFYKSIKYEKLLIFQPDSVLCTNSKYRIEDFLEYDYIGAVWRLYHEPQWNGRVGNGGLSLRSKSVMIQLLTEYPPKEQKKKYAKLPEDFFITEFINLLSGVHLPQYLIAKRFATETDHYKLKGNEISAGIHRHYIKKKVTYRDLIKLCPEYNITYKKIRWFDWEHHTWNTH